MENNKDSDSDSKDNCLLNCCPKKVDSKICCLPDCCSKKAELFLSLGAIIISILSVMAIYDVAKVVEDRENKSEVISCRAQISSQLMSARDSIEEVKLISKKVLGGRYFNYNGELKKNFDNYFNHVRLTISEPVCTKKFRDTNDRFFNRARDFHVDLISKKAELNTVLEYVEHLDSMSDEIQDLDMLTECCH